MLICIYNKSNDVSRFDTFDKFFKCRSRRCSEVSDSVYAITVSSHTSLIQVGEIMRRESGLMMNVHHQPQQQQQQQQGGRGKTSAAATSCHDDYLSGADARRR